MVCYAEPCKVPGTGRYISELAPEMRPAFSLSLPEYLLNLGKLFVVLQTLWIRKRSTGFDDFTRYYLFDRQFYFLQIYSGL